MTRSRRPSFSARLLATIVAASLLSAAPAQADDVADEAELYFRIAAEKFMARDYRGALEYFLRSNRLVPNRNVVFNIAKTQEQLGQLTDAFRYYTLALDGETDPQARATVQAALDALSPKVAIVDVQSDPPGATIFVERKDLGARGNTPRALAFNEGSYKVFAELPGHEPSPVVEVKLEKGKRVQVKLSLKKILGQVRVEGAPAAARIKVDEGPEEPVGPGLLQLTPGRHQITIKLDGHQEDVHLVDVQPTEATPVRVKLAPLTGSLVVSADERDAEVLVDGKQVGFTPVVAQVPVGKHTVRLRLRGYRDVVKAVEVVTGEPTKLEVELRQIEEVSAASRNAEAVEDAPSSVTIITPQELRGMAYPTIAEALRGTRGLYLSDTRATTTLGVRGVSRLGDYGQRILVLQDGHPMNDNYVGGSFIGFDNRVDLDDIERIEVVRGPGSVVYGANAFSGVINLVTRRARKTSAEVGVSAVEYGVARGRGRADLVLSPDAGAWVSVAGARGEGRDFYFPELAAEAADGYPATDGSSRGADGFKAGTVQAHAYYKALNVQAFYTSRDKSLPTGFTETLLSDTGTRFRDTRGFVEARFEPRIGESVQVFTRAHANLYNFKGTYARPAEAGGLGVETFEGRWLGGEARVAYSPIEQLRVSLGGEGQLHATARQKSVDDDGIYLDDNSPYRVAAGYGSIDYSPHPVIKLSGGARLDYFSTFAGTSLNPRLAVILHPVASNTIKLMGGKAFRAPSVYELFYNDGGVTQIASPGLKPETVYAGELEISQRLSATTTATLGGFFNHIESLITPRGAGSADDPIYYENSGVPLEAFGVEAELRRDFREGWMLAAQGSVQRATYRQGSGDTPRLRQVPNSPNVLGALKGAAPIVGKALSLMTRLAIDGPRYDRFEIEGDDVQRRTDGAIIWDAVLTGEESRYGLTYAFGMYNIFDYRHFVPVSNELPQRTLIQNGRTLLGSLKIVY